MKLNRKFRERGQAILLIVCLICFVVGHLVGEKTAALLDVAFALCVFCIILLEIVCRKLRPGQRIFTRKAKVNLLFAFLYLMIFVVHCALVLTEVRLSGAVRTVMSLIGGVSLMALLFHDMMNSKKKAK